MNPPAKPRDDPDVEGPVEDAERARHPVLRHDLQQVAVVGREDDGGSGSPCGPEDRRQREVGSVGGKQGAQREESHSKRRRTALAVAIDQRARYQIECQSGGDEGRDHPPGRGIADPEGPREERQYRSDDTEARHQYEADEHDRPDVRRPQDRANVGASHVLLLNLAV